MCLGISKSQNVIAVIRKTIYAEVSLAEARQKHVIFKAGEFEMNFIRDRRPELYGKIAEAKKDGPEA